MRDYFNTASSVRFIFPIDGDCLNIYDGEMKEGYLAVKAKLEAPANSDIYIDNKKAEYDGQYFTGVVLLKNYCTVIMAENRTDGYKTSITVYKLENGIGKYRISLDDNILFLADLNKNKDVYTSLFDNPYLNVYKKAHDLYGATVHINLFYEYKNDEEDRERFSGEREYFNLSMMTDKYKEEWKENSNWLKLSFHARVDKPDKPYLKIYAECINKDIEMVNQEILRFAGPETLSDVTTLHWGACLEEGVKALRNHDYKGLVGYFDFRESGEIVAGYSYPYELVKHINGRDFWVDTTEDVVFAKADIILNRYQLNDIVPCLEEIYNNKHEAGFMELLIHEQYFYEDYCDYKADFEDIILCASKWMMEHGYQGALMSEVMFK